jgi:hypothetical protein
LTTVSAWLSNLEKREPGPSPGYSKAHALLAFMTIGNAGTIGRQALAKSSGLGEGSIRTVLRKFRRMRYVSADAMGCHLTGSGKELYQTLSKKLPPMLPVQTSTLVVGSSQVAILVRDGAGSVSGGIEQRDSAVRAGAVGATTYIIRLGKFVIPGGSADCEKDFPEKIWSNLRDELEPRNGDAVIVCGAHNEGTAKLGVLSAALTLL